jgi:cell division protein ZipA
MTELRLILIIVGTLLVLGIYYWGRRNSKPEAHQDHVRGEEDWLEKLAEQRHDRNREPREEDIPYTSDAIRFEDPEIEPRNEPVVGDLDLDPEPPQEIVERNRRTEAMPEPTLFEPEGEELELDEKEDLVEANRDEAVDRDIQLEPEPESDFVLDEAPQPAPGKRDSKPAAKPPDGDELILALFVMGHPDQPFSGSELLSAMTEAGLRYGDMDIFHMHQQPDGSGPVLFSVANMMEPGTFDLQQMGEFHSPGVAMFMRLPGPVDGERAFDKMLATGRLLAQQLDGELKDETRSTLTQQTIGHLRERITDFQLKQLAKKK